MTITAFGLFFIPLALFCAIFAKRWLLPLAIIGAVLPAASVLNVEGPFEFGVPPYYLVACFIFFYFLIATARRKALLPPKGHPARRPLTLLIWLWALGVASSFILPHIFAGHDVFDPRLGIDEQYNSRTSLQWTGSNFAQAAYLTLNVGIVFHAVRLRAMSYAKIAMAISAGMVIGIGIVQIVFALSHLHLPIDFLYSNPVYAGGEQSVGNLVRINSTFTEPSLAGGFLAAVFMGLLALAVSGERTAREYFALFLTGCVLVSTTSSTGYLAVVLASCALAFYSRPITARGTIQLRQARAWGSVLAGCVIAISVALANPDLLDAALAMTVHKTEGLSLLHRIAADSYAFDLIFQTYGLGVGLGSNRPSSLFTYLLSNMGIPGTILFFLFIKSLFRRSPNHKPTRYEQVLVWGFITYLIAQFIAIPDLNSAVLWSFIALMISRLGDIDIRRADSEVRAITKAKVAP